VLLAIDGRPIDRLVVLVLVLMPFAHVAPRTSRPRLPRFRSRMSMRCWRRSKIRPRATSYPTAETLRAVQAQQAQTASREGLGAFCCLRLSTRCEGDDALGTATAVLECRAVSA